MRKVVSGPSQSVDDAARQLRLVRDDQRLVKRKFIAAKRRISENHGLEAVAKQVISRIRAIARKI